MRLTQLLVLLTTLYIVSSCQKEAEFGDVPPLQAACRPIKAYSFFTTGAVSDSVRFEYTNDRLTKAFYNEVDVITYEYSGEKVSKRSFIEVGNTQPYSHQLLSYNADGTFSKIEYYYEMFGSSSRDSATFAYTNGKLATIKLYSESLTSPSTLTLAREYRFSYTGNNISKVITHHYTDGNLIGEDTYLFAFDTKPNYFQKQSSRFLQTDPFFMEIDFLFFAFVLSENNVIKIQDAAAPNDSSPVAYQTDARGNLSEMQIDGFPALRYMYECR